jgi:aspartyl-tRNA(Asn)/glutamyl-tRNA(Gln) amidotransferase subunit A
MHNKTIAEISRDLAAGTYSSEEITKDLLTRVSKLDKDINSFITVTEEQALSQAKAADANRAAGNASAWTGVPMAHKDIFCTNGVLTTCGSKMLSNFEAP